MAKSSWLPRRASTTGRYVTKNDGSTHTGGEYNKRDSRTGAFTAEHDSTRSGSGSVLSASSRHPRSSVSGKIDLPNGQSITTVRKDVMDRALGRGDFKKK